MDVTVVAFDVDNTLTVRDCVVPFMQRVAGRVGFLKACFSSPVKLATMVLHRDRDAIKSYFVGKVFSGKSVCEIEELGVEFAAQVVGSWMRDDVAQQMRWHQSQGHVVVLVSASLEPYLQPFGDLCEVDAVLCTRLETDGNRFTGRILGNNCRGEEKMSRLREWMKMSGLPEESFVYAYGDSSGDTALLAAAQCGYMVKDMDDVREYV